MIKISYSNLVRIAMTLGYDPKDTYDSLLNKLSEQMVTVTTKAEPPGYILTFPTPNHEMLFRIKYTEILHPLAQFIGEKTNIVYESD